MTKSPFHSFQSRTKYQETPSPPFRPGGRGTKQLFKALELSRFNDLSEEQDSWILCSGKSPYLAKIISKKSLGEDEVEENSILVQPYRASLHDKGLFLPWEGHLRYEKRINTLPVEMKQSPGGYRLEKLPGPSSAIHDMGLFEYLISLQPLVGMMSSAPGEQDMISLESSDYTETLDENHVENMDLTKPLSNLDEENNCGMKSSIHNEKSLLSLPFLVAKSRQKASTSPSMQKVSAPMVCEDGCFFKLNSHVFDTVKKFLLSDPHPKAFVHQESVERSSSPSIIASEGYLTPILNACVTPLSSKNDLVDDRGPCEGALQTPIYSPSKVPSQEQLVEVSPFKQHESIITSDSVFLKENNALLDGILIGAKQEDPKVMISPSLDANNSQSSIKTSFTSQLTKPPLHPTSNFGNKRDEKDRHRTNKRPKEKEIDIVVDENRRSLRPKRSKAGRPYHRDSFLGSWPTRNQSAATGAWNI